MERRQRRQRRHYYAHLSAQGFGNTGIIECYESKAERDKAMKEFLLNNPENARAWIVSRKEALRLATCGRWIDDATENYMHFSPETLSALRLQ